MAPVALARARVGDTGTPTQRGGGTGGPEVPGGGDAAIGGAAAEGQGVTGASPWHSQARGRSARGLLRLPETSGGCRDAAKSRETPKMQKLHQIRDVFGREGVWGGSNSPFFCSSLACRWPASGSWTTRSPPLLCVLLWRGQSCAKTVQGKLIPLPVLLDSFKYINNNIF